MLTETKRYFFQRLIDDTIGYYRIYDFLKLRFRNTRQGSTTFRSSEQFWSAVLQNDFAHNNNNNEPPLLQDQVIHLHDFFLTEWTPKLPGRIWTRNGQTNLLEGLQDVVGETNIYDKIYKVLGPEGKRKMVMGGFGSVRVKPRVNNDYCMLLNAVHVNDWHADYGIPIIVSKAVYDDYLRFSHREGAPWIEDLKGILFINRDRFDFETIPNAIGAKVDSEIKDLISDSPNLTKCFIYVSSPMDIKFRYNNSHPNAVAWTMFRTSLPQEPLRLTYATCNPNKGEEMNEAVNFLNNYVLNFSGTEILTDFDGQKRRLISKTNLAETKNLTWEFRRTLNSIEYWIRREKNSI